jgi:hypothetical protein
LIRSRVRRRLVNRPSSRGSRTTSARPSCRQPVQVPAPLLPLSLLWHAVSPCASSWPPHAVPRSQDQVLARHRRRAALPRAVLFCCLALRNAALLLS